MKSPWLIAVIAFAPLVAQATARVDAPAPAFSLMTTAKQTRTLSSYKGKTLFVDFWASWCATCQQELPEINRLAADYAGRKNVRILAINVDTDRKAAKALLTKLGLGAPRFEVLWDAQSKMVSAYNIEAMPSSFIVDSRGIIRFKHVSFHAHDPAVWRQEIDRLR